MVCALAPEVCSQAARCQTAAQKISRSRLGQERTDSLLLTSLPAHRVTSALALSPYPMFDFLMDKEAPSFMAEVETKSLPENAYQPLKDGEIYMPLVPASMAPAEVTWRAVLWGTLLCIVFSVASAYSALKVGQGMEATIPISILAIGLARVYRRRSTVLENMIITSMGGASAAVVSGAVFTVPALYALHLDPLPVQTIFICLAGGCLGILFLIPLRRYFVREMHGKLPFPEATAITEVLVTGEKGGSQAKPPVSWLSARMAESTARLLSSRLLKCAAISPAL